MSPAVSEESRESSVGSSANPSPKKRTGTIVRFGKYNLILELGHGGMADVFLAVYSGQVTEGFNKLTVIKRLRANLAEDPEFIAMLVDEARLAARLNHPNVVQTNEIGKVGSQYFIAMEYLDGQPLHSVLSRARKNGGLPIDLALTLLCDVLGGLHYAHDLADYDGSPLNIVHRDVSPQNVFVTYAGQVKLVDFGIAKAAGRSSETREGLLKGKIGYMAPEQAVGGASDRRADIFAVGILLWELVSEERLWKGLDELAIFHRLLNGEIPRSPRTVNSAVPEEIDRICQKALAPAREERYATAAEFQADIEKYLRSKGTYGSSRELGNFVSGLFADKRGTVREVIEARIAEHRATPSQDLPELSDTDVPPAIPGMNSGNRNLGSETILAPFGAQPPPSQSRASLFFGAAGLAVAVIVGVAWGRARSHVAPSAGSSAGVTPGGSVDPGRREVQIILRASPANVQFTIDDGPALDNPFVSSVSRDGATHLVVARAPGYKTRTLEVTFASDVMLDLTLERDPTASAVPLPPVAGGRTGQPSHPPSSPGTPALDRGNRPVRPIDVKPPF